MEKKHILLTLGGLVLLGSGILVGLGINHHVTPKACFCNDCSYIGYGFICNSCRKRPLDFPKIENHFRRHHADIHTAPMGDCPQAQAHPNRPPHLRHDKPESMPTVKVINNEHPIDVRTGRPNEDISPEQLNNNKTKPFPAPKNHPPVPQVIE